MLIHTKIEKDVKDARSKIGAKSEKETRRAVEGKVLGGEMGGRLVELLREVAGHPDTEEGTRRGVEGEEFGYWRKLVGVLGYVHYDSQGGVVGYGPLRQGQPRTGTL